MEQIKVRRIFNVRNAVIDSFSEFLPFCIQLFYFSNYKDFNTFAQVR